MILNWFFLFCPMVYFVFVFCIVEGQVLDEWIKNCAADNLYPALFTLRHKCCTLCGNYFCFTLCDTNNVAHFVTQMLHILWNLWMMHMKDSDLCSIYWHFDKTWYDMINSWSTVCDVPSLYSTIILTKNSILHTQYYYHAILNTQH